MAIIENTVELPELAFEAEHRAIFQPEFDAHDGAIVQGTVGTPGIFKGADDDDDIALYHVRMLVGPFWKDVQSVVPKVTIDGFFSSNPDQDDNMRWTVQGLEWDTVGEFGPNNDELRIRLKFDVLVQGEHANVWALGYYLMASGRRFGSGGLNTPGPVKEQG